MWRVYTIRVSFSRERALQAVRELADLTATEPYRQGTDTGEGPRERLWDFGTLEGAQLFAASARNTAGVLSVAGP